MAPYNRKLNKYLTCFYCNRKSSTRYDGRMRQFECNNCQATNHLDSNANITDPPVGKTTTIRTAATQYASDPSSSPTPFSNTVFCNKCLQNQHLFISSLAQYLPEDPNDPEYIEREKNYHKFYRGLMKRYPQVCAVCEPKVREELNKAAYTAKTDHLRRMLDRSAETRILTTKSTVNYIHSGGKWVWIFSLLLQILWHLCLIQQAVIAKYDEKNQKSWLMLSARAFGLFSARLPAAYDIARWSFWLSFLTFWWNPKWVETWRGFQKHLTGFDSHYRFQFLILMVKLPGFLNMSLLPGTHESRIVVKVTANAFMMLLMVWLYRVTLKSIRVDHSPLWTVKPTTIGATPSLQPAGAPPEAPESREDSKKSMADILDEIMSAPAAGTGGLTTGMGGLTAGTGALTAGTGGPAANTRSRSQLQPQPEIFMSRLSTPEPADYASPITQRSSYNPATTLMSPNPFKEAPMQRPQTSGLGLGGLSLSDSPRRTRKTVDYSPNMEWSPTQSKYRAFNTYKPGQNEARKFGETPTHERAGTFWAKIPPAPTNPAQRIFNPLNQPRIRTSPQTVTNPITFQGNKTPVFSQPPANAPPSTIFANPTFRPPQPQDERDSLSEMFGKSFTLDQEGRDSAAAGRQQHLTHLASGATRGAQMLTIGLKYLVCGLCLASLAWAYNFVVSEERPSLLCINGKCL